jgi:hypothetical protein
MKKLLMISFAACCILAASKTQAVEYVAADNNPVSKLCVSAATESPIRFFVQAADLRLSRTFVANNITCNGIHIASFAKQAGNEQNYRHIIFYRRGQVEISDIAQLTQPAPVLPMEPRQVIYVSAE